MKFLNLHFQVQLSENMQIKQSLQVYANRIPYFINFPLMQL